MSEAWQYQIRIDLAEDMARIARRDPGDPRLNPIPDILAAHHATLKSQYDAFADYVAEAERNGTDRYPLYAWTKATIEQPEKQAKYVKSFTLYVDGREVYDRAAADALEAAFKPLVGGALVTRLAKHDTNPANNPQPPARYRK
jgi:hypothetical protein